MYIYHFVPFSGLPVMAHTLQVTELEAPGWTAHGAVAVPFVAGGDEKNLGPPPRGITSPTGMPRHPYRHRCQEALW